MISELGWLVGYIILCATIMFHAIIIMKYNNERKKLHKFGRLETERGTYTFIPKGEISK